MSITKSEKIILNVRGEINLVSELVASVRRCTVLPTDDQLLHLVKNGKYFINHVINSMDIRSEYVGFLLKSLIKRGLVKRFWTGTYQLTKNGEKHLSALNNN